MAAAAPMQIFIASDSTASEYPVERYPQLGWGMVFHCAFGADVVVRDVAVSGRSSKSWVTQGYFAQMERDIREGDTLLIAFGHNDQKIEDPTRYTDPHGDYKVWLKRYIDLARAKGAQPVLMTSVARRKFENGKIVDTHVPYAESVRELAKDTQTPLIDLDAESMKWLASLGEEASKKYFLIYRPADKNERFPEWHEDNTHFNEIGARRVANLVATKLAELNLPVSKRVKAQRPGLTREKPLGGPSCMTPYKPEPMPALVAFPGAEGTGKWSVGGRRGAVMKVTNLKDSGPGSLRAAVETNGPRTILFDVAGKIALASPLEIKQGRVTIAGQTAPGDGITLEKFPLRVSADDVIVRYVRARVEGEGSSDKHRVMLDHVSPDDRLLERSLLSLPDTDGDGMADTWEKTRGLNASQPDGANRLDGNAYTNLENYLASLVPERIPTVAREAAPGVIYITNTGVRYPSLQKAVDALPAAGGEITLSEGVYREKVVIDKPNVRLQGVGLKPQEVVLAWGDGAAEVGGTFKSATLHVSGDNFHLDNITIQNDYSLRSTKPSQAVALSITSDRAILSRVRLLGAQDTLYAASPKCDAEPCPVSRQYFRDCYIEGHVDFIFGDSKAFFERCEIHALAHAEILLTAHARTASSQDRAFAFDHCLITAEPDARNVYFGRPWRDYAAVVFLNTEIKADLNPAGWREWHPGETKRLDTAYYAEYHSSGRGARDLSSRAPKSHQLSDAEAAKWDSKPFLAGPDSWFPQSVR